MLSQRGKQGEAFGAVCVDVGALCVICVAGHVHVCIYEVYRCALCTSAY